MGCVIAGRVAGDSPRLIHQVAPCALRAVALRHLDGNRGSGRVRDRAGVLLRSLPSHQVDAFAAFARASREAAIAAQNAVVSQDVAGRVFIAPGNVREGIAGSVGVSEVLLHRLPGQIHIAVLENVGAAAEIEPVEVEIGLVQPLHAVGGGVHRIPAVPGGEICAGLGARDVHARLIVAEAEVLDLDIRGHGVETALTRNRLSDVGPVAEARVGRAMGRRDDDRGDAWRARRNRRHGGSRAGIAHHGSAAVHGRRGLCRALDGGGKHEHKDKQKQLRESHRCFRFRCHCLFPFGRLLVCDLRAKPEALTENRLGAQSPPRCRKSLPAFPVAHYIHGGHLHRSGHDRHGRLGRDWCAPSPNADPRATTASLTTTRNNSWVIGVGNDWDNTTNGDDQPPYRGSRLQGGRTTRNPSRSIFLADCSCPHCGLYLAADWLWVRLWHWEHKVMRLASVSWPCRLLNCE